MAVSPGRHLERRNVSGRRLVAWSPAVASIFLLLFAFLGLAGSVRAEPLRRPLRPYDRQLLDLILRTSDDADLLSPRQVSMREQFQQMGIDPTGKRQRPDLGTLFGAHLAQRARWDRWEAPRTRAERIIDLESGTVVNLRIPEALLFEAAVDTNEVGVAFFRPRDVSDPSIRIDANALDAQLRASVSVGLEEKWRQQVRNRQDVAANQELLNFTLPIKLPRTLERIIGKGEATNIRISGTETITIGGTSTSRSDFVGNEVQQNQSLFPELELQQTLRVNLDGTVGEKIKVRVSHDSQRVGGQTTEVRLSFEGDEDDIIRTIRAGDIDVTLPGSRLLGVGASRGGLFGIKVEGAMGPVEFTMLTSKEQATQSSQTFSQSGGTEDEFVIRSVDYAQGRFFRFNAPFPLYLTGPPTTPVAIADLSLGVFGVADPQLRIDPASVQVYTAITVTPEQSENIVDRGYAFLDETGFGWEAVTPTNVLDGIPLVDVSTLVAAPQSVPHQISERWRRLVLDQDYDLLYELNGAQLQGIFMNRSYREDELLAVSYNIIDTQGRVVRKVGRSIDDGSGPLVEIAGEDEPVYLFKLLKPRERSEPFRTGDGGVLEPTPDALALTWEYELRNWYDLRGRDIDPSSLDIRIERSDVSLEQPDRDPDTNVPWIRVFGLDQFDQQGQAGFDDQADIGQGNLVDLGRGLLQFPYPTPFDLPDAVIEDFTAGTVTELRDDLRAGKIYREILTQDEQNESNYFNLVVRQTAVSSRLRLNAFNIREGSEEVILNGRPLTRGTDYDIDYFSGEVNLKTAFDAQANIQVRYEVDPLFGGGRTSLSGLNLTYKFGPQNQLSSTWLYQTRPNSQTKVRLGEEPSRNLVGNLSAKVRFEPDWMRGAAEFLSRVAVDQPPTFNLDGEVAMSLPNPNTKDLGYLEDFENVDESTVISLGREGWWWASLPVRGPQTLEDGTEVARNGFSIGDRSYSAWHRSDPSLKRGDVNPDLSVQERNDIITTLEMRVQAQDTALGWREDEYAGIMRFLGEVDLSQAQFLEFWIDDGTGYLSGSTFPSHADSVRARPGRLHFDFGYINEDFFWPYDGNGDRVVAKLDTEDSDGDFLLGSPPGYGSEDTGLDRRRNADERVGEVQIPGRFGRGLDLHGDDFSPESSEGGVYLWINGTEGNQRLDSEDLDRDGLLDTQDGFFRLTLELDRFDALVDIYRDFADNTAFIEDSQGRNAAWRRYRLDMRNLPRLLRGDDIAEPAYGFSAREPDLSRVRYFRIWYEPEGDGSDPVTRRIKLADMRFLGNRWRADELRDAYDEVIPPPERGTQDFQLGVLNNKDNPDYVPPIDVRIRNNVPELEQSLQFVYEDLEPGTRVRARKDVPGSQGQDYLNYGQLNFFWRVPYENGMPSEEQLALEGYFWVGSDSLNYYEVTVPFGSSTVREGGWIETLVDLGDLTNVKQDSLQGLVRLPDGSGRENPQVRRDVIRDAGTGDPLHVVVRGRPDLRRVQRFYAGVRYPQSEDPQSQPRFTGDVLFNELRLREVNRKVGFAQRYSMNAQVPGVGEFAVEYREDDAEFRGLNQDQGSGVLQQSLRTRFSSRLQNIVPTFGLDLPFSLQRNTSLQLPKYEPRSDRELLDRAAREEVRSEDTSESFTFQVRKPQPSSNPILQYTIDRFQYSISGSRTERTSPTQDSNQKSADQKFNYDLRLRSVPRIPLPFTNAALSPLPNQITLSSNWVFDQQVVVEKRLDTGEEIPRDPRVTKTNTNNATFSLQPFDSMRGSFQLNSSRNLLLGRNEFLGVDIGEEEAFNQRLSLNYKPEFRWLQWARPNVDFTAGYQENRRPGVRQRAPVAGDPGISPEGDGFIGRSGQVRNLGNNADLNVRGELDVMSWVRWTRSKVRDWREARTRAAQEAAQRERTQPDGSTTAAPDSAGGSPENPPETVRDSRNAGSPLPGEALTAEQLREMAVQQAAERRREAQRRRDAQNPAENPVPGSGNEAAPTDSLGSDVPGPVPGGDAANDSTQTQPPVVADGTSTEPVPEDEGPDVKALLGKIVQPFQGFFGNLRPISTSWQRQKQSQFQHVNGRADLLFRLGLAERPDFSSIEPLNIRNVGTIEAPEYITQDTSLESVTETRQLRLNTQSQVNSSVRVDLTYSRRDTERDGARGLSFDRTVEWPNVSLRISQVQQWRLWNFMGKPFDSSSIDVSYKATETLQNQTSNTPELPRTNWTFNPRWNFRLRNGFDTSVNVTLTEDESQNLQSIQRSTSFRSNVRVSQQFDASGRLAFLRFGQRGTGTTIDMNVTLSYSQQRSERENQDTGIIDQPRGTNRLSLSPQFTYQFSRNLRGGLKFDYSRSYDIARDATTTSVGVFLDATLNF